jgi:hypothetical protein
VQEMVQFFGFRYKIIMEDNEILNILKNTRTTLSYDDPDTVIGNETLDSPLILTVPLTHSSSVRIKDLKLINFTFNQTVELGTFQSTGRINFIGCTFNENVTVASDDYISFLMMIANFIRFCQYQRMLKILI